MTLNSAPFIRLKFLLYIGLLFTSCRHNNANLILPENSIIIGKEAKLDGLLSAKDIYIIDSLIIIQESGNTYHFIVYNKRTLKLIGKFGRDGRGPSEYNLPKIMNQKIIKRDSSFLIIFDLNLHRIDSINILAAINKTNQNPKRINIQNRKLSQVYPMLTAVIAADSFVVGSSLDNIDGRFFCYDIYNNILTWEPFYPIPKIKPVKRMMRGLYTSNLALRPTGKDIAAASLYFERIDILDKKGNLKRSIVFENKDKDPDFSSADRMPPKGVHEYFTSITVTSDFIYSLNIDLNTDDKIIKDTVTLIKATWEDLGAPPKIFKMTPQVMKIAVDNENQKIYGIQLFSSDIYIFDLK